MAKTTKKRETKPATKYVQPATFEDKLGDRKNKSINDPNPKKKSSK